MLPQSLGRRAVASAPSCATALRSPHHHRQRKQSVAHPNPRPLSHNCASPSASRPIARTASGRGPLITTKDGGGGGGRGPLVTSVKQSGGGVGKRAAAVNMEAVRIWFGMPAEGAVERLSVVCAHCNAKLTPPEMDYACQLDKLAAGLRPAFKPLTRDAATNDFLMRSSQRPLALNWGLAAACTYLRKFMSLTDANAILGRGRMHVLSQEQAADLMRESLEASLEAMAPAVRVEGGAAPGVSGGGGGGNSG
eukprot:CAMPEP_0181367714 /NCGR_PEP_ID=MMETSP1106-20121128/11603_1 /TAXON_ID=81844 /ORGANISM="Mantoniella antarctica, Strain SL-175" /LENGTH=250 /DNA_ID=CAMNT_0023483585 /DNA_START=73 /DNA_END=822 /DNA_ORIENTATION=-